MSISGLLKPPQFRPWHGSAKSLRSLRLDRHNNRRLEEVKARQGPTQRPSLLEELFPKLGATAELGNTSNDQVMPRLPLLEVDDTFERSQHDLGQRREAPKKLAGAAAANAFKQNQLAILILQTASKSLVESDFRRVTPKGKHIDDWTGPGDVDKGAQTKQQFKAHLH